MEIVKKHPLAALLVAFAAGVMLSPHVKSLPLVSKLPGV